VSPDGLDEISPNFFLKSPKIEPNMGSFLNSLQLVQAHAALSIFGLLFEKNIAPEASKNCSNGEIAPNLVTLAFCNKELKNSVRGKMNKEVFSLSGKKSLSCHLSLLYSQITGR
jgi:hypothetical protein